MFFRKGAFYEHDSRGADDGDAGAGDAGAGDAQPVAKDERYDVDTSACLE